jgi:UDP-glucose 4-epimerase
MNPSPTLKNILVTGGCGFIGTNLVKYLSQRHYKVRILDNLSTASSIWTPSHHSSPQAPQTQSTELLVGDIRDPEVIKKAVEGIDAVVHLAAHASVVDSLKNPKENWDVNVNGTLNLLEACRQKGIGKFIFASSNAVLGEQPPPVDESKIPRPLSLYGASKLAGEALCSAYYHSFGLNTISLRFANCYGPHSKHNPNVITRFMDWARQGKPLIIYGDGNQTRDFIHADDICQAIHLALISLDSGLKTQDLLLFQIASGVETSVNELVDLIRKIAADHQISVIHEPRRKGEIERNYSDITKARKLLGFKPKITLKEGLGTLCKLTGLSINTRQPI